MPGFIHDKLEIKFLILYIAARLHEPAPFETMLDLSLCDDGVGYFDFNDCLRELVETEHLSLSEDGLYTITEKGRRNGAICESDVPYSVRLKCDKNVDEYNRAMRRKRQVRSTWERRRNGSYTLRLSLDDDMGSVMDLRLAVPREDMARVLADRFQKRPEQLYTGILGVLLERPEEKKEES